jgi:hypothetical protein
MKKTFLFMMLALALSFQAVFGQNYAVKETKIFKPQEKKVLLYSKASQARGLILFYSKLRVNTDSSFVSSGRF